MTRQERIRAIYDTIIGRDFGDAVSHRELLDAIHEQTVSQSYRDAVNQASKRLLNAGKMIESIHKYGYRIVDPDEYTTQSVKRVTEGAKKIDEGTKILSHAPVSQMSQAGLERYRHVSDRMVLLQAQLTGAKVEIQLLGSGRDHPFTAQQN